MPPLLGDWQDGFSDDPIASGCCSASHLTQADIDVVLLLGVGRLDPQLTLPNVEGKMNLKYNSAV